MFQEETLPSMEPFHFAKGSFCGKKRFFNKKWSFKIRLTESFFGETNMVLLWHHFETPKCHPNIKILSLFTHHEMTYVLL